MTLFALSLRSRLQRRWHQLIGGRRLVIGVPYAWLIGAFLLPFLIVLRISFIDTDGANDFFGSLTSKLSMVNYRFIASDELYFLTYLSSLRYAALTTLLCLLIGYPFAWFMARARARFRPVLLMLVMLPFWTSFLLRIYAWKGILADQGLLNHALLALGVLQQPLHMMHTPFSLMIGLVYAYLPFMILPLYANLLKLDMRYLEAALDLGATPLQTFWRVTVPLSKSGIIAGCMLVFIPTIGEYVIPELLGGPDTLMIGRLLWDEFFTNNDWPIASALTVVAVLLILLPMALFNHFKQDLPLAEPV